MQDDLGAGRQPVVAVDVLDVDLERGADRAVDDELGGDTEVAGVGDAAGDPVAALGYASGVVGGDEEIFSGRTPSSTFPPAAVGPLLRAEGRTSLPPPAFSTMSSPDLVSTSASMKLDVPRKLATNVVRGFSYSSLGGPSCSTRPPFITATVSAMVMASSWSCVTCTKVMPTSVWMRLSSSCI